MLQPFAETKFVLLLSHTNRTRAIRISLWKKSYALRKKRVQPQLLAQPSEKLHSPFGHTMAQLISRQQLTIKRCIATLFGVLFYQSRPQSTKTQCRVCFRTTMNCLWSCYQPFGTGVRNLFDRRAKPSYPQRLHILGTRHSPITRSYCKNACLRADWVKTLTEFPQLVPP